MEDKYTLNVKPKLEIIEEYARNGLSEKQIAYNLGISYASFRNYKKKHEELRIVLQRGKEVIDLKVENALLKCALGYTYDEVTYEHGNEVKRVTKNVKPDVNAQKLWLINRNPAKWKCDPHKVKIDLEVLKLRQKEIEARLW
ncbi:MAG: transposase [Terrisporobacter sp.]